MEDVYFSTFPDKVALNMNTIQYTLTALHEQPPEDGGELQFGGFGGTPDDLFPGSLEAHLGQVETEVLCLP